MRAHIAGWLSVLAACTSTKPEPAEPTPTPDPVDTDVVDTVDTVLSDSDTAPIVDDTAPECTYPEGAVDPMTVGEVLPAYRWPKTIHADGRTGSLALSRVPCAVDPLIDWSPFDVLLFVSIPAW